MQLRTKLILYSMACCALGVLFCLGIVRYGALFSPAITPPLSPMASPASQVNIKPSELNIEALKQAVASIEAELSNNSSLNNHSPLSNNALLQALGVQERLRAEQIKHELGRLEQLKQEQLQIKLFKLEQLKDGLLAGSPRVVDVSLPLPPTFPRAPNGVHPPDIDHLPLSLLEMLLIFVVSCSLCGLGVAWLTRHLGRSLDALEVGLLNFNDNDFSVSIPESGEGQLKALAALFNESAAKLRRERQYIYQRELLLDKVIQSSPNVMLLLNDQYRLMYANDAARHFFRIKGKMEGLTLDALLQDLPETLVQALKREKSGLFALGESEADTDTWHLSRGQFLLNNQQHHLILLKQMTRELNRQEVAVWKKVIRIISHELNNSVAPIASMVNSGRFLTKDVDNPKLRLIFDTIENRTNHLSQFIFNYARFAKLPLPQRREVLWPEFIEQLTQHYPFRLGHDLPSQGAYFDPGQMEQVLLNLLKNAHESGSPLEAVTVTIRHQTLVDGVGFSLHISDRGAGMSGEVLEQALLPFYSTKQSGTGLGLPLCREIIEAHDGNISLHNRRGGGLSVQLWLPQ